MPNYLVRVELHAPANYAALHAQMEQRGFLRTVFQNNARLALPSGTYFGSATNSASAIAATVVAASVIQHTCEVAVAETYAGLSIHGLKPAR